MWQHRRRYFLSLGPVLALGLFTGRILSELIAPLSGGALIPALTITAGTVVAGLWLLGKRPFFQTWPLFFLVIYVLSPEPDPKTAALTTLLVAVIYGLQLRLNRPWPPASLLLFTLIAFIVLYVATIAPGVLPADSGEFQLAAVQLGVAHPPGFSLYTMLAHLMTRLPGAVTPAFKVNLFSVITSVLTLWLVYLTVYRLTGRQMASLTAVIALGTATTFWAQATTANIRSLTGLFASAMIYTLVRFREEANSRVKGQQRGKGDISPQRPPSPAPSHPEDRWLILFALTLGFGVTHHASLAFMGLVFLIFILSIDPLLLRTPRRWLRPFLAGTLGLLPLLYFPLRAGAGVRGASMGLLTWEGFLNHVLALGFRGDLFAFITSADLWPRLQVMANVLTFQFHPWLLLGMALGLGLMVWRDRRLALLFGGSFALHTFITATYRAPQTVEYMLPAYIPLVIGLGYGVGKVAEGQSSRRGVASGEWQVARGKLALVWGAVMLITAVFQGWQHYPSYAYRHQDTSTSDYTRLLLEKAPTDAVILADWHWATPLWYWQEVAPIRPDVSVRFVFPEGETYGDTWARRIAEAYDDGRPVIATHFDETAYARLPLPEPLADAYLFRQQARSTLPADFQPLGLTLDNRVQVLGYRLAPAAAEIGQETVLTVAWQPAATSPATFGLFVHLVDGHGRLWAQSDLQVQPQPDGITLTQFRLTPRVGATPGEFAVMLGTPENSQARTTIATLSVEAMRHPPVTQNPVCRPVFGERPFLRLIGYDWDNTLANRPRLYLHWQTEQGYQTEIRDAFNPDTPLMPDYFGPWGVLRQQWTLENSQANSYYIPLGQGIVWTGNPIFQSPIANRQSLKLPQTFRSSGPILHDLVISVRLIGYEADNFNWAWWDLEDSIPAMGAIPTLKWIAGSEVWSPYALAVDPAARPGQRIDAVLRVYDAFTNRPLPILDDRITNDLQLPWVPLGQTVYTP